MAARGRGAMKRRETMEMNSSHFGLVSRAKMEIENLQFKGRFNFAVVFFPFVNSSPPIWSLNSRFSK